LKVFLKQKFVEHTKKISAAQTVVILLAICKALQLFLVLLVVLKAVSVSTASSEMPMDYAFPLKNVLV
jgi:hypothetical protein